MRGRVVRGKVKSKSFIRAIFYLKNTKLTKIHRPRGAWGGGVKIHY